MPSIPDLAGSSRSLPTCVDRPTRSCLSRAPQEPELHARLPKGQRPLDLFFLVDTTGTMKRYVDELKLAWPTSSEGSAKRGYPPRVGLASTGAYPDNFPPRPGRAELRLQAARRPERRTWRRYVRALQSLEYDGGRPVRRAARRARQWPRAGAGMSMPSRRGHRFGRGRPGRCSSRLPPRTPPRTATL